MSDRKSRRLIRRARRQNSEAVVVVTGCYAQVSAEEIAGISGVDLIIGTHKREQLPRLVEDLRRRQRSLFNLVEPYEERALFEDMPAHGQNRTRSFLKIQEGCRQFCTYCIVPYARGPLRSRQPESVLRAVENIAASGFKELVLTGVHLGLYGEDFKEKISLADLLYRIDRLIDSTGGIERLRLSSLEPGDITPGLIEIVAGSARFCKHLHLPLQSGNDYILKKMGRSYDTIQFAKLTENLRQHIPDLSLTTDIIVGFPGETEEQFLSTRYFVEQMQFSRVHVFKYSPRRGTSAAEMPEQVTSRAKEERSKIIIALGEELAGCYRRKFIGRTLSILFETSPARGWLEGLTGHYIRVRAELPVHNIGNILPAELCHGSESYLIGKIN